ncbi:hypothetical protein [Streptomyces scabiei]|uniref:hypothetical protein n=1 Tax=Streptomyces scabiei TaxID=1930 RepID=UPI000765C3EA|nr:hypothetical protein [Streptomyces scabiei]
MATLIPPQQSQTCNHRALEVVAVILTAVVAALVTVLVTMTQGASSSTVISTSATIFLGMFAAGIGAVTYIKHGS